MFEIANVQHASDTVSPSTDSVVSFIAVRPKIWRASISPLWSVKFA